MYCLHTVGPGINNQGDVDSPSQRHLLARLPSCTATDQQTRRRGACGLLEARRSGPEPRADLSALVDPDKPPRAAARGALPRTLQRSRVKRKQRDGSQRGRLCVETGPRRPHASRSPARGGPSSDTAGPVEFLPSPQQAPAPTASPAPRSPARRARGRSWSTDGEAAEPRAPWALQSHGPAGSGYT